MKKLIIASLLALSITLSLCSCAGTSESDTQSLVSNPFETSEMKTAKLIPRTSAMNFMTSTRAEVLYLTFQK